MARTKREEVPQRHFQWWQILLITLVALVVISGGIIFGLSRTIWKNVSNIEQQPAAPAPIAIASTNQPEKPTPEKVLGPSNHGLILFDMGEEGHVAYGLGSMFIPPGSDLFPRYEFPLYVSKTDGYSWTTIAVIPDPEVNQIGTKWESSMIKDPDYENFVLKVELTRVTEVQKYNIRFSFSPDNGKGWLTAYFPPESRTNHE